MSVTPPDIQALYQGMALAVPQPVKHHGALAPAATYERSTSIINVALRSDCNKGRPWLVLVVAKKMRSELKIPSGCALRAGLAIAGG